ncbi:3-oxo-tetronate kinase [Paracoccus kondratievae]|uniref:3-oxo-tetronate kinase n=1 Tax=Paracoccus kondratievae TaxID=135740 RepID=A0AAD3NXF8_9RHOB|nr:3-oxo-tetronate kinase [Paracoccus kondratievae]GLK63682.1 HPr kinase [Paracoccus kondratievae]
MFIGAIADDLTGATDLSLTLSREGMRVLQVVGVPTPDLDIGDAEAVVVSMKSRTNPAAEAVCMSLAAAEVLRGWGARQFLFKYCSTFDSTDQGNIGPVADALMTFLGTDRTIACPAFPTNGRTVYRGHLFVGDRLLSESSMKDHPLTPMRDADLVRVLGRQSGNRVSLIGRETVAAGDAALKSAFDRLSGIAIVDAIDDADLRAIGRAARDLPLITGGSGIALGLPANFLPQGRAASETALPVPDGRAVFLAGSCSAATRQQIARAIADGVPALKLDAIAIAENRVSVAEAVSFCLGAAGELPPLVWSSAEPAEVQRAQDRLGRDRAGAVVEAFLSDLAEALAGRGFNRFVIAGGETSGAVVTRLGVPALEIGPEIDPGVPWTRSRGGAAPLALALKSGNFGAEEFFLKAWRLLP